MDESELEAEKSQDVVMPVGASLKETEVTVSSPEGVEEFSLRGYGVPEDDKLRLTFYEALFLLSKGAIEVEDKETGEKLVFQELLKRFRLVDKDAWVRYLIYRDLRSRGYVAREG
ncbi:hypothetical protein KAS24_06505, partial [Candidatus Bathyarchaeota archaeon]|nr:hypothetical protein [Candidatus Bathyarchaeota archaeon]